MDIRLIIVGKGEWERYTLPCLKSLKETNPDIPVTVIDINSEYPDYEGVIHADWVSYAEGINIGIKKKKADWYIISNNDIIYKKPLAEHIAKLDPDVFYSYVYHPVNHQLWVWDYVTGCNLFISHKLWKAVGEMDVKCWPLYFEDVDYSYRAVHAGFGLGVLDVNELGVYHLEMEREKDRSELKQSLNKEREIIKAYVRAKHGF